MQRSVWRHAVERERAVSLQSPTVVDDAMRPVAGHALLVLNLSKQRVDGVIQGHLHGYRPAVDPAEEDLDLAQGQRPLADTRWLRALRINLPIVRLV